MEKIYNCSLTEADFEYQDDSRIVDTSLISRGVIDSVEVLEENKIESTEDNAAQIGIDVKDMKQHDSWYMINGKPCYFKNRPNNLAILNELLCVELSKYLGVPTIEYKIATKQKKIVGLVSENFLVPGYEYTKSIYAPRALVQTVKRILTDATFECDDVLRKQITGLVLRNFYASLIDRRENSYYATDGDKIIIPPTHDFESAFRRVGISESMDPLFGYNFNPDSIDVLKENNKYFLEYVEALKEYNMLIAMASVEEKHRVIFPNEFVGHYCDYDANKKELMKTLGF